MAHYNAIPERGLMAMAKEHGIEVEGLPDKYAIIDQLVECDIMDLAQEKGIQETGVARLPPRLPHYKKTEQLSNLGAFCSTYAMWSMQNRDILDRCKDGKVLINPDERARLEAYVRAEDAFIAPKEKQGGEEAKMRWHTLLDAAQEVGVYVYEYRVVEDPLKDKCTNQVRPALYDALEQARTDREAMLESRRRIAAAKAAAKARKNQDECCCIIM